jgi:uncharacterized SAM-binding protein YcdF (DUF218 family)
MAHILLILLGCNVFDILLNRIEVAGQFLQNSINTKNTNIDWFLSGGIKFAHTNAESEAIIMQRLIKTKLANIYDQSQYTDQTQSQYKDQTQSQYKDQTQSQYKDQTQSQYKDQCQGLNNWNFILDTKSTNTAQNFVRASLYYNQTSYKYSDVYIITSAFHKERANKLMNYIDPTNQFKWILGLTELADSRHMEQIHIKNVYSDFIGAIQSIKV